MNSKINITSDMRAHPNLRKLARALLALAQRQRDAVEMSRSTYRPDHPEAVKPKTGDAA